MVTTPPRLVVAAPASGHGKTTLTTGLLAALVARGVRAAGAKVGPDYIDPSYHALATGRPGRNLDPVLQGAARVAPLLRHGAAGADVVLVEGVMGLYDGLGATDTGSTADVARLLDAPVLLVVDAAAMSRSVAATVLGLATLPGAPRIGGVVLNRVASDRHAALLRAALRELVPTVPVLGELRRRDSVTAPRRHLGLVPVAERRTAAAAATAELAAVVAASVDLDAVLRLARSAPSLPGPAWSAADALADAGADTSGDTRRRDTHGDTRGDGVAGPAAEVVAVAGGPAFSFGYPELGELLTAAGAQVAVVDPLTDTRLPAGCTALVLPGGFPQLHAGALAANSALAAAVRDHVASGAPVYAECAGLLYLCQSLDGSPMAGVLRASAAMTGRLTVGYRHAASTGAGWLRPGPVVGHEFHRTALTAAPELPGHPSPAAYRGADRALLPPGADPAAAVDPGIAAGPVVASYLHLHPAGTPSLVVDLLRAARTGAPARAPHAPLPPSPAAATVLAGTP